MSRLPSRLRQAGLSIVELLVAMTLGLAVLLGAGSLMVGSAGAHAALLEAAEMDDSGRYAMNAVARAVRLAAHVDWAARPVPDPTAPAAIAGIDAHAVSRTGAGIDPPLPNQVNGSDVLALRFTGSGAPPNGDGATLDCAGFPVHRDEEGWSIFYVARNAQGDAELRCKYRGASNWSSDAVAGGVDGFQVLYGLDTDDDGAPNRYLNASEVEALDAALMLVGATPAERAADLRTRTHWKRVAAVRVALLLHGPRLAPGAAGNRVIDLFGPDHGAAFSAGDPGTRLDAAALDGRGPAHMRKVYQMTVAVPVAPPLPAAPAPPEVPPELPPESPPEAPRGPPAVAATPMRGAHAS